MERARLMFRVQALLERDLDELSEIVVRENGKSIDEARGEVRRGIDVVEFAAGMPTLMMGGALEQVSRGVDTELFHHPLGVVAAITPFNFPAMVPLWTAPIAIAAGQLLHPEALAAHAHVRACGSRRSSRRPGAPDGVFNVVHGAERTSQRDLRPPESSVRCRSSARLLSRSSLRALGRRRASASRPWPVPRTTSWSCRTPISTRRTGLFSSAFANAGQRCLAGVGRRRGWRDRRRARGTARRRSRRLRRSGRARSGEHDHTRDDRRGHGSGSPATSTSASRRAHGSSSTAASSQTTAASSSGRRSWTTSART